jgi:membrane fusion protein (multidrug efflux system)
MSRRLLPLLIATPALIALAGCGASAQNGGMARKAEGPAAVTVQTATAQTGAVAARHAATTTLEAEREARVVAEVGGIVLEILVEEGDRVRAGQVLARLDPDRARLEVQRAEATVARLENEYRRNQTLFERKLVSRELFERSRFDYETQRAALELERLRLRKTDISAPFDGVVTERLVKEGQLLETHRAAFVVADFSRLKAVLHVPERLSPRLREGQPARLSFDALGGLSVDAEVARVSPRVDRGSGTVPVTILVDNRDGRLRPGLFSRAEVLVDSVDFATLVPRRALLPQEGRMALFVVNEGRAERRQVELGVSEGDFVQVLSGIEPGAEIVVLGHTSLTDGMLVAPLAPAS